MAEYKAKESFEELFRQSYVPIDYKTIQNELREAAAEGWELFTEEYRNRGRMNRGDYILYMTSEAYGTFEEIVERAIEELNGGIVDVLMEISSDGNYDHQITEIYYDTLEKTLKEMLDALYDDVLCRI